MREIERTYLSLDNLDKVNVDWCQSVSRLCNHQTNWKSCVGYPFMYRCVGHNENGGLVCGAFWKGTLVYI